RAARRDLPLRLVRDARARRARDPLRAAAPPRRPRGPERRRRRGRRRPRRRRLRLRRLPARDREAREPVHPAARGAGASCNEVARFRLGNGAYAVTKSLCSGRHGACGAAVVPACRGRHPPHPRDRSRHRRRGPDRMGVRLLLRRPDRRRRRRASGRSRRRLRPVPDGKAPALGGTAVVLLALPVFLVAGWRIDAWGIAAGLWAAYQAIGLLLRRVPLGSDNLAAAGLVAFGRMTRAVALVAILIAIAVANADLGLPAAVVYGLAFTVEFALSLVAYFGGEAKT